jgi:putative addiction module component (TIGR02574 family)
MKIPPSFDFSDLSNAERLLIAEQLLDGMFDEAVGGGFTQGQMQEMEARMQAADEGRMKRISWEEARKRLARPAQ